MTIDCSLNNFKFPGLPTYSIPFGLKKESGRGLSTAECADDIAMPFVRQRPFIVTETSDTTELEASSVFKITTADVELTVADAAFDGCTALIVNASASAAQVKGGVSGLNGQAAAVSVPSGGVLFLVFYGGWISLASSTQTGSALVFGAPEEVNHVVRKQELDAHENRTDNPHAVTKAQVGLGNCDDTADADKSVAHAATADLANAALWA